MNVRIEFRDVQPSERVRDECRSAANTFEQEFPEMQSCDVRISHDGELHEAHVHVTGKGVDVAASASEREIRDAVHEALERARKQLRKRHDKKIFARRRSPGGTG